MKEAYIIDGVRTPIGKHAGSFSFLRADDLAAHVILKIRERNPSLEPRLISDVIMGCANQAGEDNRNVARMALLLAGLPYTVPGETVNRLCASGMSAVVEAARAIRLGDGDIYIAGGVENMTRAPFVVSKSATAFSGHAEIYDTSLGWRFVNPRMKSLYGTDSMGETAENLAGLYNISREDQDLFACRSQRKASEAQKKGRFKKEITEIEIPQAKGTPLLFSNDEFIRPNTTLEILAALKPAFRKDGTVTAGNSSGINDGACALFLASESAIREFNFKPHARIVASAVVGVEPSIMGIGPVRATLEVLKRSGLSFDEISVIELNEAFAAQVLACLRELRLEDNDPRLNPNGGAIALGHPLGMSGARLITTAMYELEETQKRYALCTMCVGVGQGMAVIIENMKI
ncbi:MAG: 3-oxoadipyl-CoA thiolase [Ignavibacteria bacterium]|nr:3-oxoadipyl-CoA thiolase [Ignavibacteria bacterium]MCU7515773.1 3-oxoadipyl-CoA thiolase [Ignavibacteria bacterium]